MTLSCLSKYYPSRMGTPEHNWERTQGLLATLPAHTPCAGGDEVKVGLKGRCARGSTASWVGAFYGSQAMPALPCVPSVQDSKGATGGLQRTSMCSFSPGEKVLSALPHILQVFKKWQ